MLRDFQDLPRSRPKDETEVATLRLYLPDWGKFDTVARHRYPFALWRIGSQRLLHYWLDYAVDHRFRKVLIFCHDRPAEVRGRMKKATLWPVRWQVIPLPDNEVAEGATPVTSLPEPWDKPDAPLPHDGWSLLDYAFALERVWYRHAHHGQHLAAQDGDIGRFTYIHPSAKLTPPFWIGDNVYIGPHCEIGPHTSIGSGCVLEGESEVADSKIERNTFIGAHTGIRHRYVDQRTMIDLKHRTRIDDIEPSVADGVRRKPHGKPGAAERLAAFALWTIFRLKKLLTPRPRRGNQLWLQRYPHLLDVVGGRCHIFGILPRSQEDLAAVREEWRDIIRNAPRGVFSYADALGCHSPQEELEPLHAVYQATHSPKYINPLCRRFVWSQIQG